MQKKDLTEDQAIGRSKGGLSTKIHATCDALGNPTGFHLTPGQQHVLVVNLWNATGKSSSGALKIYHL